MNLQRQRLLKVPPLSPLYADDLNRQADRKMDTLALRGPSPHERYTLLSKVPSWPYLMNPGFAISSAPESPLLDRAEGTLNSLGALLQLPPLHLPARGADLGLPNPFCTLLFFVHFAWPTQPLSWKASTTPCCTYDQTEVV